MAYLAKVANVEIDAKIYGHSLCKVTERLSLLDLCGLTLVSLQLIPSRSTLHQRNELRFNVIQARYDRLRIVEIALFG